MSFAARGRLHLHARDSNFQSPIQFFCFFFLFHTVIIHWRRSKKKKKRGTESGMMSVNMSRYTYSILNPPAPPPPAPLTPLSHLPAAIINLWWFLDGGSVFRHHSKLRGEWLARVQHLNGVVSLESNFIVLCTLDRHFLLFFSFFFFFGSYSTLMRLRSSEDQFSPVCCWVL